MSGTKSTPFPTVGKALWSAAERVSDENLLAYRVRWQINRARLEAAAGHTANEVRTSSVYEPGNCFQDRLNLLEQTRTIFSARHSPDNMSLDERKRICGTAVEEALKRRLFGSMSGSLVLKKRVADNDVTLSRALDLIPSSGPVTKEHTTITSPRFARHSSTKKGFKDSASRPGCSASNAPTISSVSTGKTRAAWRRHWA